MVDFCRPSHNYYWKFLRVKIFEVTYLCELNFKDLLDYQCRCIIAKIFEESNFEAGAILVSSKFSNIQYEI